MRCVACEHLSLSVLCRACRSELLDAEVHYRTLESGMNVLSFFPYDAIDHLLKTKHTPVGYDIYRLLSKELLGRFAQAFRYDTLVGVVGIDDQMQQGYAHTAIMARAMRSAQLQPDYRVLQAQNSWHYSTMARSERARHPRNFSLKRPRCSEVILVDDIITTGTTMLEAQKRLESAGASVLMGVVFADADR